MSDDLAKSSSSPLGATPAFAPPPREALRRGSPKLAQYSGTSEGGKAKAGVNFSGFSKHATGVELQLFGYTYRAEPRSVVVLFAPLGADKVERAFTRQ